MEDVDDVRSVSGEEDEEEEGGEGDEEEAEGEDAGSDGSWEDIEVEEIIGDDENADDEWISSKRSKYCRHTVWFSIEGMVCFPPVRGLFKWLDLSLVTAKVLIQEGWRRKKTPRITGA